MKYKKKPKKVFNDIMNKMKIKKSTKNKKKLKFMKKEKGKNKKRLYSKKKINKAIDKKNIIKKIFYIVILILFYLFYPKNIALNNLFYNKKRVGVVCILYRSYSECRKYFSKIFNV